MSENSVAQAFSKYRDRLLKFIRSRVRALEDAEDIVQEVFYQYMRVNDLANPVEQTAAWLYRAARNKIIDSYRKKEAIPFSALANAESDEDVSDIIDMLSCDETTPETAALSALVWEEIEAALAELPKEQRDIFIQTEMEGLPVKEIAEMTGVQVNTLLSRKHYAVIFLRKRLREVYADITEGHHPQNTKTSTCTESIRKNIVSG